MDKVLRFGLIFSISYLILLLIFPKPEQIAKNEIFVNVQKEFQIWDLVEINLQNTNTWTIVFENKCPNSFFEVEKINSWVKTDLTKKINTKNCTPISLFSWEKKSINFWENNIKLFWEMWEYKIILKTIGWKVFEKTFEITEQWFFWQLWDWLFYKPVYNSLIALIKYWPNYSLAFWIIMLTIVIKLILLIPNYKALKSQKDLQKVQPELAKIKERYKWDSQKIAEETMKVWKKYKVNPLGSCLPMLIQMPFLIAIFYIIKDWLTPNNSYLLYSAISDFDFSLIQTSVFWIFDLKNSWNIILAIIVWGLQYLQMTLTLKWQEQKASSEPTDMMAMQMQIMWKMMKYVMPAMIAIFTYTMPAWVWLYWLISIGFWVLQQLFVNKKSDKNNSWKWNKKLKNIEIEDWEIIVNHKKNNKQSKKDWVISKKNKDWITTIRA